MGFLLHPPVLGDARRRHAQGNEVPLPPVADSQAVHVERPVRHARLRWLRSLHHLVPGRNRYSRRSWRNPRNSGGKVVKTLDAVIAESPVFFGLTQEQLEFIVGCAQNVHFEEGQRIVKPAIRPTPSTSSAWARSRSISTYRTRNRCGSTPSRPARSSAGRG